MRTGDLLFVYGSLRRGESNDLSRREDIAEYVGQSRLNGTLHALGWYPGINLLDTLSTDGAFSEDIPCVVGDVFRIMSGVSATEYLDMYEGHPSLFFRTRCILEDDKVSWVYSYPHEEELTSDNRVFSGDWSLRASTYSKKD